MPSMTSRERVYTALNHQQPDRVPVDLFWQRSEIMELLRNHFKVKDDEGVRQAIGADMVWGPGMRNRFPAMVKKMAAAGQDPAKGNRLVYVDGRVEDVWGTVERPGADGKYMEWVTGPLAGVDAESSTALDGWDVPETILEPLETLAPRIQEWKDKDAVTMAGVSMPFKLAWMVRGMEDWLVDMIAHRDFAETVLDKLYDYNTRIAVRLAAAGIDILTIVGDIAGQTAMMYSPKVFRQLDKPRLQKLFAACRAANPDMKIFYHSDGNMEAVVPDFIDLGLDILNPIQPDCMDPEVIKRKYGDKLTFHGTLSVQDTIPFGTVAQVRAEVTRRIATVGKNGGFILAPSNVIPYDAPIANVLEIWRAAGSLKE